MQNAKKNACNLKKFQYNKGEKPNRTSTDIFWKEGELMYKKRFLRLVSAVLALCMMAALLPTAAFAAGGGADIFVCVPRPNPQVYRQRGRQNRLGGGAGGVCRFG